MLSGVQALASTWSSVIEVVSGPRHGPASWFNNSSSSNVKGSSSPRMQQRRKPLHPDRLTVAFRRHGRSWLTNTCRWIDVSSEGTNLETVCTKLTKSFFGQSWQAEAIGSHDMEAFPSKASWKRGNAGQLFDSVHREIFSLDSETQIFPGRALTAVLTVTGFPQPFNRPRR